MATTTRQASKTITMAPAPEESVPEPVTQRKQADGGRFRLQVDRQTMKPRKKWDWGSRKSIRSFRSRCMTV
jgi:hypothetical protein